MKAIALVALLAGAALADKRGTIDVGYDAAHLDLDKHVLQFKPSRAVAEASLVVIGEDGHELGKGSATYAKPSADPWWTITWSQTSDVPVMMLKLRVAASDGAVTNVQLIPWSVTVDHEDVNFATNSAVIDEGERAKLDASLAKIDDIAKKASKFLELQLYIAGHTDTVGPADKNRKLSLDRARAIATYFRGKGLALAIAFAGFGEDVPKVKTPDETDERANRRADYVLGPIGGAAPFKGPYLKVKADWKVLR